MKFQCILTDFKRKDTRHEAMRTVALITKKHPDLLDRIDYTALRVCNHNALRYSAS